MFARNLIQRNVFYQTIRKITQTQKDVIFEELKGSDSGITVFGFNRPKQKNALSANLVTELQNSLHKVMFEASTRVLIIRSLVPGIFCAGNSPKILDSCLK